MRYVLLDLNALYGMQLAQPKARIEPYLADPENLLILSDHVFLEACHTGLEGCAKALGPLVPYRDRARTGVRHSELFALEKSTRAPAQKSHLLTVNGRTESLHAELGAMIEGRLPYEKFLSEEQVVRELARRNDSRETADLVLDRFDPLDEAIKECDRVLGVHVEGGETVAKRLRRVKGYNDSHLGLCLRMAADRCEVDLIREGTHPGLAGKLASIDSFLFRHELAYWTRALMLRRDDLLRGWVGNGKREKIRNEHFDIEFVAMATYADIAITEDNATREHLELVGRALALRFGANQGPMIAPERTNDGLGLIAEGPIGG